MEQMKNYKQLIKELPSKTVVFAFGRFNPPTTGHELLVKTVKKLAAAQNADHAIYASKTQDSKKNPLDVNKKVHYLNLMFPKTHFIAANAQERTFIEAIKTLNKKYKNLIMVAGSDRIAEYEKILQKYNGSEFHFDTVQVISAGERDPDSDDATGMSGTKMRALAAKGNYAQFKQGLPSSIRDIDGKLLMNDIRLGMGLEIIKEQVKFTVDSIREQYFKGEIYNIGQFVESNETRFEILDRGSNYLVLVDTSGNTSRKWIQDVTLSQDQIKESASADSTEITFKGYTTQNLHNNIVVAKAFQESILRAGSVDPVAILNALKATDTYMSTDDIDANKLQEAHSKAKESLDRVGEFSSHENYWQQYTQEKAMIPEELTNKTLKPSDKLKVARIIATMLGIDKVEGTSDATVLVNNALRKVRSKSLNPEGIKILDKMLALATEVGIEYDTTLKPAKLKEEGPTVVPVNKKTKNNLSKGIMSLKDYKKLKSVCEDAEEVIEQPIIRDRFAEAKSSLEKWRIAAAERQKKHDAIEAARKTNPGNSTAAIDALEKHLNKEEVVSMDQSEENLEDQLATELDLTDDQIDHIVDSAQEDDFMDEYEDDELAVIDQETGEEIEDEDCVNEQALSEVLSRSERMRAKIRFAKTKSKRERKAMIAIKSHASNKIINTRARRLAIKLMKKKLLRGRDVAKISVGEKERIERVIQKRKSVINRVAMKLAPRVRQIEKSRLSHTTFTKAAPTASF